MSISATVLLLATTVYREAGGTGHDQMVKVADVVVNRVHNERFPSTVENVILQQGQFSGNRRGQNLDHIKIALVSRKEGYGSHPVWDDALRISQEALSPGYQTHHNYLYFNAHGGKNHFNGSFPRSHNSKIHYHGHKRK